MPGEAGIERRPLTGLLSLSAGDVAYILPAVDLSFPLTDRGFQAKQVWSEAGIRWQNVSPQRANQPGW
jgi:hypothetical protein